MATRSVTHPLYVHVVVVPARPTSTVIDIPLAAYSSRLSRGPFCRPSITTLRDDHTVQKQFRDNHARATREAADEKTQRLMSPFLSFPSFLGLVVVGNRAGGVRRGSTDKQESLERRVEQHRQCRLTTSLAARKD